jgi:hypothetical protein
VATAKPSGTAVPRSTVLSRDRDTVSGEDSPLADARRLGEAEAEVADLQLRLKESHSRERRLLETTLELQEALEQSARTEQELRQQLERYATYHRAVERSAAWRLVQFLRQLMGRRW